MQAQQKLAAFRPKIGYPNMWRDYSKVQAVRDDLVGNTMRARAAELAYQMSLGGKPAHVMDGLTGDQRFFMGWATRILK